MQLFVCSIVALCATITISNCLTSEKKLNSNNVDKQNVDFEAVRHFLRERRDTYSSQDELRTVVNHHRDTYEPKESRHNDGKRRNAAGQKTEGRNYRYGWNNGNMGRSRKNRRHGRKVRRNHQQGIANSEYGRNNRNSHNNGRSDGEKNGYERINRRNRNNGRKNNEHGRNKRRNQNHGENGRQENYYNIYQ